MVAGLERKVNWKGEQGHSGGGMVWRDGIRAPGQAGFCGLPVFYPKYFIDLY